MFSSVLCYTIYQFTKMLSIFQILVTLFLLTVCLTSNIFLINAWISSRLDLKFSLVCKDYIINTVDESHKYTHILHSYLQICHVGLAVLSRLVALVVEGDNDNDNDDLDDVPGGRR